jgi:hypothetical protein
MKLKTFTWAGLFGLAALTCSPLALAQPVPGNVVAVDASADPGGTGNDWSDAVRSLQDAIDVVRDDPTKNEIWVKAGTYYPDDCDDCSIQDNDRAASFALNGTFEDPNIKIRGGFAGGETLISQRQIFATENETILSGDIDETPGNNDGNSRLIVSLTDVTDDTFIDAFTIEAANNDYDGGPNEAAAIRIDDSSAVVMNCTVQDNVAINSDFNSIDDGRGAGLFVTGAASGAGPTITNTMFLDNTSGVEGGGVYVAGTTPTMINCVVARNATIGNTLGDIKVDGRGGGIYVGGGSLTVFNTTITENVVPECTREEDADCGKGGGIFVASGGAATIRNSILWCNASHDAPAAATAPRATSPVR